jgi:hypothetical protein
LLDAVDIMIRAIEDRVRLYRNLVVAVSTLSVLSILLSALFRQWLALTGLLLLVPLTGGFLFLDSRLVRQLRAGIVEMARLRSLDRASVSRTFQKAGFQTSEFIYDT